MRCAFLIGFSLFLFSCKKDFSHLDTKVFGHAGISLEKRKSVFFPNQVGDVQYALQETDLNGTEIDVQMTSDGELVLFHDQFLDDNSNLTGCIPEHTWAELQFAEYYKTNYQISKLDQVVWLLKVSDKTLLLDVKHHNSCANQNIDFVQFNTELNEVLAQLNQEEKSRVIVNSRSLGLLQSISDTLVQKSLESDDPDFAIAAMQTNNISILVIKLEAMTSDLKIQLDQNSFQFGLYNFKTRKENEAALEFAPDFVISDNIDCTLKSVNG